MARHMGMGLSRLHCRRHVSRFLWVWVPFNIWLNNMPLPLLQDDPVVRGAQGRQHPVLLVGELHFFIFSKDAADLR